jgi:hypothetical protein
VNGYARRNLVAKAAGQGWQIKMILMKNKKSPAR